jgi:Nucleotidyl transferase AbiEii toxin, Type IV TA system
MIPEPQRTYLLELLDALGPAGEAFVIAGAQAMKFTLQEARPTKDIDFILDAVKLRGSSPVLRSRLEELEYRVVDRARNFQFEKSIPGSLETMRIEFMAPEEFRRAKDIRVDIQPGVHGRACVGGNIALQESDVHSISGTLPDDRPFSGNVRVTRPHSLVMLKLLALKDRYDNLRGPMETRHDREEARVHAADISAIVSAAGDLDDFKSKFVDQFRSDAALGVRVLRIFDHFFRSTTRPGFLVYEESLAANLPPTVEGTTRIQGELERVHELVQRVLPQPAFFVLAAAIDDVCNYEGYPTLSESFLVSPRGARVVVSSPLALQLIHAEAFGQAYTSGEMLLANTGGALEYLTGAERQLLQAYLKQSTLISLPQSPMGATYGDVLR